ncbi:MAG: homocysteine S-methyltransferase family protein, partial [Dehalococcoidia bacterium]
MNSLRAGTVLADGGIGSLIFQLTGRLASTEFTYEALNLQNPELIKGIHSSSLAAGATVLTTNTFSANATDLAAACIENQTTVINQAAVRIAREAIAEYQVEYSTQDVSYYVIGSIGPGGGDLDAYQTQIDALIESGVDALLLETFTDIDLAMQITSSISSRSDAPPVIVHGALDPGVGEHRQWPVDPAVFATRAAEAGAAVAGINCVAPWAAAEFVSEASSAPAVVSGDLLLSAMPNAGGFERIGHRFLARANPEYMGSLARQLGDCGASLVGGCCEVHPEHVREMSSYLKSLNSTVSEGVTASNGSPAVLRRNPENDNRKMNGEFSRKLLIGEFVISVEMVAPTGADPKALALRARMVKEFVEERLADAVDITDGSRGMPLVPPGDLIELIRDRLGWHDADKIEFIPHFAGRDLNTLAVQSRMMGYHLRRIRNVLFITGDPPKMSPTYPRSSAVFDMNSVQMIRATANQLNQGRDFGGNPLGGDLDSGMKFTVGTGFEPEAINMPLEIERLQLKIDAGADYVMTQPVFDVSKLETIEQYRQSVPVLPGVMVLRSVAHAVRISKVPGVNLPSAVIDQLSRFDDPADQAKVGLDLAVDQAHLYKSDGWAGI